MIDQSQDRVSFSQDQKISEKSLSSYISSQISKSFYLTLGASFRTKMNTRNVIINHKDNTKESIQKVKNCKPKKIQTILTLEKLTVDLHNKISCQIGKFKLKVSDWFYIFATWNIPKQSKRNFKMKNWSHWWCCKYAFTKFWSAQKKIEKFGKKLGIENCEQHSTLRKNRHFISIIITSSRGLTGKKKFIKKSWKNKECWVVLVRPKNSSGKYHQTREDQGFHITLFYHWSMKITRYAY